MSEWVGMIKIELIMRKYRTRQAERFCVKDGLELGIDSEAWLGGGPDIYKSSPQAKYILSTQARPEPYIGAFYTYTFVENKDDLNLPTFLLL